MRLSKSFWLNNYILQSYELGNDVMIMDIVVVLLPFDDWINRGSISIHQKWSLPLIPFLCERDKNGKYLYTGYLWFCRCCYSLGATELAIFGSHFVDNSNGYLLTSEWQWENDKDSHTYRPPSTSIQLPYIFSIIFSVINSTTLIRYSKLKSAQI